MNVPNRDTEFRNWKFAHKTLVPLGETPAAAGVLPFCTLQGNIYFLLGREAYRRGFEQTGTWCDFGGGVSGKKKTSIQVAAQELQEETFGSIMDGPLCNIIQYIETNTYFCVSSDIGKKTPYHMYITRIPYCDIPDIFMLRYKTAKRYKNSNNSCCDFERIKLKEIQPYGFQSNGKVRKSWLEKDDVRWVPLNHIENGRLNVRSEFLQSLKKYDIIEKLQDTLRTELNGHAA